MRLNVGYRKICDQLLNIGKIQNTEKWAPHQLNDRQMESCKTFLEVKEFFFASYRDWERKIYIF